MADDFTNMLQDELEKNEAENTALENENKMLSQSVSKTFSKSEIRTEGLENAENDVLDNAKIIAEKTPSQNAENDSENDSENFEENAEFDEDEEDLDDDDLDDWEDEDEDLDEDDWEDEEDEDEEAGEMAESDVDPLDAMAQVSSDPPSATIEDLKKVSSPKNLKNLEKLGFIALDRADKMKAGLCSHISGQHMAEYTADDELKEALIEAIKEYLASQEFKALTPAGTLMLAVAMWSLPPLGLAYWHKYEASKEEQKKKTSTKPSTSAENGDSKSDYSHLKEFKEGRRSFTVNKTEGTYNRTPKGTFIKLEIAKEKPSPEIQELIDEGLKCKQIREIIYGE